MELFLMQHGKALPAEEAPQQPLSPEGVEQVRTSAAAIKKMGISFDVIISSPKQRARQTAALVAEAINYPQSDIVETDLLKAMTPATESIRFLENFNDRGSVLIVGHLPSLGEIASSLLTEGCRVNIHFENAGLCRLDCPGLPTTFAELRWYLTQEQMRTIAAG